MTDFWDTPNGRLLLAAPDLLEALEEWTSLYEGWSDHELARRADPATIRRIAQSRAVIAKAKGVQP